MHSARMCPYGPTVKKMSVFRPVELWSVIFYPGAGGVCVCRFSLLRERHCAPGLSMPVLSTLCAVPASSGADSGVRLRSGRPRYMGRNPEGAATPTVSARHRCSAHQARDIGPNLAAFPLVRPPHPAGIVQSSGPPDLTRPGIYSAEQAQEEPRRDWITRHRGATVPGAAQLKTGYGSRGL